jgi:pimeloyl-ACP methyl ester carboxylesterase
MTRTHELPDGVVLAYDDLGTGRPVVLLHGMSMSRRWFARNVGPLAERFRVVNVDLRSHGDSPIADGGNTVAQHARDVKHLIDALALEAPVLVGWSMGTMVVWDLIRQFGTVGLGGHVNVSQGPSDLIRDDWPLGAFPLDGLLELLAGAQTDYAAVMDEVIPLMYMDDVSPADRAWMLAECVKVGPNAGTCTILNQSVQDYRDVVGSHDLPTLLTWGRDEKLISVANGEWVAERQQAPLVLFERSGHCPMWEEAERFNQVVGDWIASL